MGAPLSSVTISIVTYNSEAVIADCLRSLPDDLAVIVVDNASSDKTCSLISADFPQVELILLSENKGFGAAHNVAMRRASTPYLFLFNPDAVLGSNCLEILLQSANAFCDAAIIAPALLDEGGKAQLSYNTAFYKRSGATGTVLAEAPLCAEFLSGAAMLVCMDAMKQLGGFDEHIFLFYEDDDMCLRARAAGYSCVYVPTAKVMHMAGRSSPMVSWPDIKPKYRAMAYSELYLYRKYCSCGQTIVTTLHSLMRSAGKAVIYGLLGKPYKAQKYAARFLGAYDFVIGFGSGV